MVRLLVALVICGLVFGLMLVGATISGATPPQALVAAIAGSSVAVLVSIFVLLFGRRSGKRQVHPDSLANAAAEIVGRAKYRGRRVFHYSDGSVVAETRKGLKQFANFDDYRQYVDRR